MSQFLPIPKTLEGYTGNKSQAGVYQFIINHVPKHLMRIECFLGSGIISSRLGKERDEIVIGGDLDELVCDQWTVTLHVHGY